MGSGALLGGSTRPVAPPARWPDFVLPQHHPRLAHYLPYHVGDSLASVQRAARDKCWGIDVNMHPTADLVGVAKHWGDPAHPGDGFTHLWTGPGWGRGELVPDPHPSYNIAQRLWAEVQRLTDATGRQRIARMAEFYAEGVKLGVHIMAEAKGPVLLEDPTFWDRLGAEADAVGHPRVMMTLSDIGSATKRLRAAKAAGFQTAVLPRGKRPAGFDQYWDPVTDRVWGTVWDSS